jgi:CRISPR-associated protein Csm5
MNQQTRYETYSYKLTTLSPLHIGTGEEMLPMEYFIDRQQNRIIVPELEKLFACDTNLAPTYFKSLSATQNLGRTFNDLLSDHKPLFEPTNWRYSTCGTDKEGPYKFPFQQPLGEELKKNGGKIRLATKNSNYQVYIPGSSIKGALRTAWLYKHAVNDKELLEYISKCQFDRDADRDLNNEILQGKADPKDRNADPKNKIYDLFRVVQVGDSQPLPSNDVLGLVAERILSAKALLSEKDKPLKIDAKLKDSWTFYEAIRRDSTFTGKIIFDVGILNSSKATEKMGWTPEQKKLSLTTLCQAVNEFAKNACELETEYFSKLQTVDEQCEMEQVAKFYGDEMLKEISNATPNTMYFSLGHGSGWHKLTIGELLRKKLSTAEFKVLRSRFKLATDRLDFEYPKSRKLPMSKKYRAARPFGWVKIEFSKVS